MQSLLLSSLLFSFSFGLIGRFLGGVDPVMVALIRLCVAVLVFLPFLRIGNVCGADRLLLAGIGAIQYGLMYIVYIYAFRWLSGHEVALYTVVTPLYVSVLHDLRKSRFHAYYFMAALLATVGGGVLVGRSSGHGWGGIALIQISNVCFAFGQVEYKLLCARRGLGGSAGHFALLYAGGALLAGIVALAGNHWRSFAPSQEAWLVMAYLGIVPSALGFFFWNRGGRQVQAGVLAAANNVKIPLAVLVSLVVFRESVVWGRFLPGGLLLLLSLWLPYVYRRYAMRSHKEVSG